MSIIQNNTEDTVYMGNGVYIKIVPGVDASGNPINTYQARQINYVDSTGAVTVTPTSTPDVIWLDNNPTSSTPEASQTLLTAATTLPSGASQHEVSIIDGIRTADGEPELISTGEVSPSTVTGWTNPHRAKVLDGQFASIATTSGAYSETLVASGFSFDIPPDAVITGIKVRVARRKL